MPKNSVAVFFGNPVRNRANDVDYVYQDPDFLPFNRV
jgi:Xaa-Pro aminopeptidase